MFNRKKEKAHAKRILKKHYAFLLIACLLSGLLANEFSDTFSSLSALNDPQTQSNQSTLPSKLSASNVLQDILNEHIQEGAQTAETIEKEEISESHNPALGRTNGVFASILNSITSGSIFVSIVAAINSIVGSESISVLIMILLGLLLYFLVWFYIQNTFSVVLRRIFLEARTYEKVSFERYMYLSHIKKWTKASFTLLVSYVYQILWALTIIGFFIKRYSYFLVPYIVAENPNIRANQAITLSRQMMNGHKWECFKIDVTFWGWNILSSLTFGLSGILFSNPYKMCTFAEYYAWIRNEAKKENIDHIELLNDRYLFQKPDLESLTKAYPEIRNQNIQIPYLPGIRGFFANFFGILFREDALEKEYETKSILLQRYKTIKNIVEGKEYPRRLFPIAEERKSRIFDSLDPFRNYTIWSLILMFFIFSTIGWIWEVSLQLISNGVFVNRGVLHGPWLPIYGSGGILILTLLKKTRPKPLLTFFLIIIVCGILEYSTSYIMELNTGLKWWDYSGYFLNLDGRICAEGLMVFGIGGMAFIYILAPIFDNLIHKITPVLKRTICIILLIIFTIDAVYSHFSPNTGEGITDTSH